jgi:hypothetical protein
VCRLGMVEMIRTGVGTASSSSFVPEDDRPTDQRRPGGKCHPWACLGAAAGACGSFEWAVGRQPPEPG